MIDGNQVEFENIITSNGVLIEDLLGGKNKIFEIPLFQRNYNWSVDNCRELYDDIINSYKNNSKHFIGIFIHYNSIVSTPKTSNVLIDGQQRLTTIMLLLCAIREVTTDIALKKEIDDDFIYNTNKNIKFRFKLKQNNFDNDNFEKVLGGNIQSIDTKSKIFINYSKFVDWITEDLKKINLKDLVETIKNIESVEIVLKSDDIGRVQQIFEKINSTGQPLNSADLIRNYLLFAGNLEEQQELYNRWTCIENIVGQNNITHFVRSYTIRYSYTNITIRNVYNDFKNQFKNMSHKKILDDMLKYAIHYAIIQKCEYYSYDNKTYNIELLNNDDKYINNTLKMLNHLGTDDWVPLFMILFDELYKINKNKLSDILELILEFMIRYRVVQPSAGGGALQSKIYNIMKCLVNKECPYTVNGIYNKLSTSDSEANRYPTDNQFMASLKANMLVKNGRVLLYQFSRRQKHEIMDFDPNITLEHLMPQTIDPSESEGKWWINHLGKSKYKDIQEKYTDCIGNYALLTRSLNSSISNSPWPTKRKEISVRCFDDITRNAANEPTWKENNIKARNDKLSNEIRQWITGPKSENKNANKWLI